jgi:uncharacterized protein
MKRRVPLLLLICFLSVSSFSALAQAPALTANDIAARILHADAINWEGGTGWKGGKVRLRMILTEKGGAKREQVIESLARRHNGLLQTVVRFFAPPTVAGTAFLMLESKKGPSEQYIYLPGLKRTRRIVGRESEGSFMGSDIAYADMQPVDTKYSKNVRLPDEQVGASSVYVLESKLSADAPSLYSRVVTWIRKTDFVPLRTRFYDKQGRLCKTLYARRIRQLDGRPLIVEARMENEQNGHVTEIIAESIERHDDFPDATFTPTALEHW